MKLYKKLYYHTFNKITDLIYKMENDQSGLEHEAQEVIEKYIDYLKDLQCETEEMYISSDEEDDDDYSDRN